MIFSKFMNIASKIRTFAESWPFIANKIRIFVWISAIYRKQNSLFFSFWVRYPLSNHATHFCNLSDLSQGKFKKNRTFRKIHNGKSIARKSRNFIKLRFVHTILIWFLTMNGVSYRWVLFRIWHLRNISRELPEEIDLKYLQHETDTALSFGYVGIIIIASKRQ